MKKTTMSTFKKHWRSQSSLKHINCPFSPHISRYECGCHEAKQILFKLNSIEMCPNQKWHLSVCVPLKGFYLEHSLLATHINVVAWVYCKVHTIYKRICYVIAIIWHIWMAGESIFSRKKWDLQKLNNNSKANKGWSFKFKGFKLNLSFLLPVWRNS